MTRGLPGGMPDGERLLWQGSPDWRVMARTVLHARKLALYFGLLAAWSGISASMHGAAPLEAALATLRAALLGAIPVGLAVLYAWLAARATVYTITDRRIVLRIGLAVSMSINLPFAAIASAGVTRRADGSGDIAVLLAEPSRLGYVVLWPHARPWRLFRVQPSLRALADVQPVALLLGRALAASAGLAAPVLDGAPNTGAVGAHAAIPA